VQHNAKAASGVSLRAVVILVGGLSVVFVASPPLARRIARPSRELRAAFLLATGSVYLVLLWSLWPLVTAQDYMPVQPLIWLLIVPPLANAAETQTGRVSALVAIEAVVLLLWIPPVHRWRDSPQQHAALIADVLRVTDSSDTIVDLKGETVYRRRTPYFVFETITRQLLASGDLADDTPKRAVSQRTFVAVDDNWAFPARTRAFLNEFYIRTGHLRVAGAMLRPVGDRAAEDFDIAIPGAYAIVTAHGPATGLLDGHRVDRVMDLPAGHHVFVPDRDPQPAAVLWARAWHRGFTPFAGGARPHG
jgi:hypothetical protein